MKPKRSWIIRRKAVVGLLSLACLAAALDARDFTYTTNNGTIKITGYTGSGGDVIIPSAVNGLPVTAIGYGAFYGNSNMIAVTVPDTVTTIEPSAFALCWCLAGATISGSLTNVGTGAFASCYMLTNVVLGDATVCVSTQMFASCWRLIRAPIASGATSIGDSAFIDCSLLQSAIIPNSVTNLGAKAFSGCSSLNNVILGRDIERIAPETFSSCSQLGHIDLPPAVTSIGTKAFENCGLTNLVIGNSVTNIEQWAFVNCFRLRGSVTIPASVISLGPLPFDNCLHLSAIFVEPDNPLFSSVDGILCDKPQTTLIECPAGKVGSCVVPSTVTRLGDHAFFIVSGMTAVYFQGAAPILGSSAFTGSTRITVYYLPGTAGWGTAYGGRPTAMWRPQTQTADPGFGVGRNGFGFKISWVSGMTSVVEACTNLGNPNWYPLATNTFVTDTCYFVDPDWTNCPARFYRVRWP